MNPTRLLALAIFMLGVAILAGGYVVRSQAGRDRPAPTAIAAVAPTVTSIPPTAESPTATPTPMPPTAEPTADPTAEARTALVAYARMISQPFGEVAAGLSALDELLPQVRQRRGENDWTIAVAAATVRVQDGHAGLVSITPPSEMAALHAQVIDATGDCDQAMELLRPAIDQLDSDMLQQALDLSTRCGSKLEELSAVASLLAEQ